MRANTKITSRGVKIFLILLFGLGILFYPKQVKALEWYENLISDSDFINKDSMSLQQIQDFLASKGSYLANSNQYCWGECRTAAQWIYLEAREHGINPQVIMVTLQKENSLITLSNPSQTRLDWAMGFGAYSGCASDGGWCTQYQGFGNQIHSAALWMRSSFDQGKGPMGSTVGQTVYIQTRSWESGSTPVYLSNRATAVLYRYTPYIYNGNYNFWLLSRNYFGPMYSAQWVGQSEHPILSPGQSTTLAVEFQNIGRSTWYNTGSTPVNLGTSYPRDRFSGFVGPSGWISGNRIRMQDSQVVPGGTGTFRFEVTAPASLGTFKEYFQPVVDNFSWLEDQGVYFVITVELPKGEWAGQSEYPTLSPGQSATYSFVFRNTGRTAWKNSGSYPVNLGTSRPQDRNSGFSGGSGWLSTNRIKMDQAEVAPGQLATFTFQISVPSNFFSSNGHGVFREYVQLVQDGVSWLNDQGIHFLVTVP